MTAKLPVLSGEQLIRVPQKFGYVRVWQKGSHVRLRHPSNPQRKPVTVPLHPSLARGALLNILRDAEITRDQLAAQL